MKAAGYVVLFVVVLVPLSVAMATVAVKDVREARADRRDARTVGGFERRTMSWLQTGEAWRALGLSIVLICITIAIAAAFIIDVVV